MGKLKRLELYNFKSYKGHHVLQFGDSYFTSIIGPNGSGKSNSMDAISFVLGIKSSHLRSQHLRDLVYRGRVLRTSKIGADGGVVEDGGTQTNGVNGHTQDDEGPEQSTQASGSQRHDPQTAWVMAVYEDDGGDEQKWKRSITSSGASEYRINNRIVNAKQYNEALEAENILIKARNFLVFQGDVEQVANQAPKDITKMIEQISGSIEYEKDYDSLKKEMEKAGEDQEFKLKQRRALNGEIKQYQEQKREAESYQRKLDERDLAIVTQVLYKLFHFQRVIEESGAEIQKHQQELKEFRRGVEKYEQRLEDARKDQAKVGREVSKADREIKRKERDVEDKLNGLVPIDEKISITSKNIKAIQQRVSGISKESEKQSQSVDKLTRDLATVEKAQRKWEAEWQQASQQSGRALSHEDLQEYQNLRTQVSKRVGSDQNNIDAIKRSLRTDEETGNNLKTKVEGAQLQVDKVDAEVQDLHSRLDELNTQAIDIKKLVDSHRKRINHLESARLRAHALHRELNEKLRTVLTKISEANDGRRESEKEQRAKQTVADLKKFVPGVRGRLCDLCKPKQKKFETAVSTALGRYIDAIVVNTDDAGKNCIQHLRDSKAGTATFIPLDSIQVEAIDSNIKGIHRGMRLAVDAIDCDGDLERAVMYACRNTMICDDLQVAKQLVYDRRINAKAVALDGTVIHKAGTMTGGQTKDDARNARTFGDAELDNLKRMAEKYHNEAREMEDKDRISSEEETLVTELKGAENQLAFLQNEAKALERNIESKTKELKFNKRQLDELQPKYQEALQVVQGLKSSLQAHQDAVSQVEDTLFANFCQRLGYGNIREYEARQGSVQQEADQKKREFTTHISKLKTQLNFETTRLNETKDRIKNIEARAEKDEQLVQSLEADKEGIRNELDVLKAERDQLEEDLEKLREQNAEKAEKVAEQRRELQKRSKRVDEELKSMAGLEAEMQRTASARYALLRKCKIEEINIPLIEGSATLESLPLDDMPGQSDPEAMDVDGTDATNGTTGEVRDYGIEVNFDELDDDLKEDDSPQQDSSLQEAIAAITSELEKMAPNMRAVERLEGTEARAKATDREFNAARTAFARAKDDFEEVKEKRLELFNKAFDHIADQIGTVYKELTRSSASPQGGQAYLDKEDDDEPYLSGLKYHAMPPLKRFRDMEHLSGGEKTMAALALLFAVHSYQPSPFFVLDEVDAALDNANVAKIANYVRDHAGPGMQFIVISLKTGFFERSETLVGVMRDQGVNSSRTLTLDLRKYQEVAVR